MYDKKNECKSNYFDVGKEWWGTGMWSVYNPKNRIIVVIGESVTD